MPTPFLDIYGMNANKLTICTHYLDKNVLPVYFGVISTSLLRNSDN